MYLDKERFKQLVQHGILFSIDLIVMDDQNRILFGKRLNRPAQGYWFVPGGRVYKNEPLAEAFKRICQAELGKGFEYNQACLLGLFDHFYDDSVFGTEISTHYINAPYLIKWNGIQLDTLPLTQHKAYKWLTLDKIQQEISVHPYSKVFLDALKHYLEQEPGCNKG